MDAYRAPFLDARSRKPVWRWPNEIPLDGEPRDVVELVTAYSRWLGESPVPKLLLTFDPGAILDEKLADYCRKNFANLETLHVGAGIHFVHEDQPEAIGDAIKEWRGRLRR